MDDAESTMIETLPGRDDDELGKTAVAEVGAAMTCPAAHLDALRPAGITFCSSNSPSEFPSEYPEDSDPTLLPCTICNRTFNPQALERHRKVCEKLSSKRRKTFNSTKQRVDGLDIPPLIPTRGRSPESKAQQAKSKSKWREKHREFLMAIRAAKGMPDDEHGNDGPPAPNIPSDYVQCPQCERHFGPKAADRHIEWCKEKATRMPRSPANTQAAERLKTRTKYAPPKPGQNGWRAPKKSDVISSIPPPSSGPTPTPGGALGAREFSPPSNRQMSPPRSLARQTSPPLHAGRHLSPPPMTSSRRTSISSVASLGRSGSMSLGRSAGKQLSAMLSSGHSSGYGSSASYGTSSGYGQSSKYGQLYGYSQQPHCGSGAGSSLSRGQVGRSSFSGGVLPLVRQGSMRSSLRRTSSSTPMARHRDLTSDMMASVCISPDPKRGEPEGDEAGEILPTCSSSLEATFSNKTEKEKINQTRKKAHGTDWSVREKYDRIVETSDNEEEETQTKDERTSTSQNIERKNHKNASDLREKREWCSGEGAISAIVLGCDSERNGLIDSSSSGPPHDFDDDSDNEILNALKYNYDSEEELDIPTEENFLKSSTSVSGDDEALDQMNFGRPRSVHFEDEMWEDGEYKLKEDTEVRHGGSKEEMLNRPKQETCVNRRFQEGESISAEIQLSKQGRLSNVKSANKESVREILRRKREEAGEVLEQDDRRRAATSVDRLYGGSCENLFEGRGRSKSRERLQNGYICEYGNSEYVSKKSVSAKYSVDPGRNQRASRSRSPAKGLVTVKGDMAFVPFSGSQNSAGVIISRRDYVMFRSLAEKQNKAAGRMERERHKITMKSKRSNFSKSGSQRRLEDVTYDPFSAAELQMQALMGLSKPPSSKGTGLGPAGLGLGVSMMESVRMEGTGRESPDFDFDMGLEEFEKEYQSTKTQSLGYGSPKLRARKDARSSVSGLGKRSDSLSGLSQEQTAPGCDLELDWSWKDNPSSSSDCWRAGTVSPTFKKSSWGAPRETRNNNQNLLASVSQENISNDAHRWSSARESSRESRSWSSPSRETTWTSLTHDIHNWSASAQGNDSLSLPSRDSPRKSSPAREIRYGSPDPRKSSPAREIRYGSPDPRKSSPAREIRYGSPDPRKSSPAREIRYGSPDRSSHGWISPTRDSQSSTNDTNRFSSPTRDSVSESSVTNDGHSWSSPARDRHSPPHDSFKPFTHDNHTRSSLVKDSQNKDFAMDAQELSLPTQETYSRFSKGHNTYRSSPSRDKENIFSSDRQKEILPSFESQRLSSSLQKSVKDSSFGYDARSWSSPTRERLGDSPSGYSCLSDILDNNKNDSSKFRELSSWKSAAAERQKDSSVDRVSNAERPTQDRCFAMGASFGDRRSLSPARDTDRWGTSAKDEEGVVNTTTSNKSQSSWGAGESSSGLSSLSKHFGGSLINTQQSTALLTTSDEGYKKKSGFETYRATQDSLDSDMNSAKKGTNSGDDSHLRVSSGSSSDSSSLPPLSSPTLATSAPGNHTGEPGSSTSSMKMPRFCHECGHKYPVLLAKFCCHCGSRRASVGN
ncbi:uro-adherence factor A-like isoform X3 [Macrobrachium rosenbergii]|uniref:uro-adherence factor A-like isoform X3 n=2 Tax=Macrobrachium rosenbergii TaxID=79674 RepID=UPI0034D795D1